MKRPKRELTAGAKADADNRESMRLDREYASLCNTGSIEPDRRNRDLYLTAPKVEQPPNTMVGFGKRIIHLPKNGNPRVIPTDRKNRIALLERHWA